MPLSKAHLYAWIRLNAKLYTSLPEFISTLTLSPQTLPRPNCCPSFTVFDPTDELLINSPSPFVREAWETLLEPYPGSLGCIINGIILYGCRIGYNGPHVRKISKNLSTVNLDPDTLSKMLLEDLALGRIEEVTSNMPFMCSPLGFVPKPNGKLRRIHHLSHPQKSSTNNGIEEQYGYLEYSRVSEVCSFIIKAGKGCLIMKNDWEAAFRTIPVAILQRWLLGLQWNKKFYRECCLCFGLRTAPFIFNLFAEAFHWILQAWLGWVLVCHYLDDIIHIIPQSKERLVGKMIFEFLQLTTFLGIPINVDKYACSQVEIVFGFELNTNLFTMSIPTEKITKIHRTVKEILAVDTVKLWDLQVVAGLLSWAAPAVQLGWVFCRKIWSFFRRFDHKLPNQRHTIPKDVRDDLLWWYRLLPQFNGTKFFYEEARETYHLFTDASGTGMGGFFYHSGTSEWKQNIHRTAASRSFDAPYSHQGKLDINTYEVRAILLAFERWGPLWRHQHVVIRTDNSAAFRGIVKGTLDSTAANEELRKLLCLAATLDIVLAPAHIAGKDNELADALSRFDTKAVANWCPHW